MAQVRLILQESVTSLGEAGDLILVKPGFARNFLLPQGKALLATESRVKEFEHKQQVIREKLAKDLKDLEALKHRLQSTRLAFTARSAEEGKLFGSITAQQIAEQLAEKGLEIDRRKIVTDSIKTLGEHSVAIRLGAEVVAEVKVDVTAEED